MQKPHFEFQVLKLNLPSLVILMLKRNGWIYPYSFIFAPRWKKEDFVLKYPQDTFPPDESIEILIHEVPTVLRSNEWKKAQDISEADFERMHIAHNETRAPGDRFICHYPGANHEEALKIAKFWSRYNLMHLETGGTSTDAKDVMMFSLDEEIRVIEIG